jgi:hypothetical protein
MRFGTWNVRSLYWAGSLTAAAMELARYKLGLVGVQELCGTNWAQKEQTIIIFLWKTK